MECADEGERRRRRLVSEVVLLLGGVGWGACRLNCWFPAGSRPDTEPVD